MSETWEYGDESAAPGLPSASGSPEASPGRFPWPPGEDEPVLAAFGETWRGTALAPSETFARTPRTGGTGPAIAYYLIIAVLVAGAGLFWESLSLFGGVTDGGMFGMEDAPRTSPLVTFLLTPAFIVVGLFISSAITHVILLVLGGATHGYGTTLRVFAYGYSPGIFGIVPLLGSLVGGIWILVVVIIGLREAHETDGWKTAVAVLLPVLALLLFVAFAFAVMVAAGAAVLRG